tara:strand:- start:252 stop:764 length:513 start_codon:yes stop_codon:yes gene_type:complete
MQMPVRTLTVRVNSGIVGMTMTVTPTDYDNPWYYKGTTFTSDDIGDFFGFVYRITNTTTGKEYIGRKYFYQFRKPRGKSRKVKSESDWKKYYGSSQELNQDRKSLGNSVFRREIISLHATKGWVNYEETRQLFLNNVLSEQLNGEAKYYNSNILGRYMKKDYYERPTTTD